MHRLSAIVLAGWLACTGNGSPAQRTPDRPDTEEGSDMTKPAKPATPAAAAGDAVDAVAKKILELGYLELFQRMDHDQADALWRDSPAELESLVKNDAKPHRARFLAAEVLYLKKPGYPAADERPALAVLYAEALGQSGKDGTWGLMGNIWGLTHVNEDVGTAGKHLLDLGPDAAIPALKPLLTSTEVVLYEGSEEATVGNEQLYRVKDMAAYYLGRLTKKPLAFHTDWKARDREIEKLARTLP